MAKPVSTYERYMQDVEFKKEYQEDLERTEMKRSEKDKISKAQLKEFLRLIALDK